MKKEIQSKMIYSQASFLLKVTCARLCKLRKRLNSFSDIIGLYGAGLPVGIAFFAFSFAAFLRAFNSAVCSVTILRATRSTRRSDQPTYIETHDSHEQKENNDKYGKTYMEKQEKKRYIAQHHKKQTDN